MAKARKAGREPRVKDDSVKPSDVLKLPAEAKLRSLLKNFKGAKGDRDECTGRMGNMVSQAVEKDHLDKFAFSQARAFERLSNRKLAVSLPHFLHYLEVFGVNARAAEQEEMFARPEIGERDDGPKRRRHRRLTQHSLPGGSLGLTWAGLAPADRASFAWRLLSLDHLVGNCEQRRGYVEERPELRGKAIHEVLVGEDPCPVLPPVGSRTYGSVRGAHNAVAPGVIDTDMSNLVKTDEGKSFVLGMQALKRIGQPDDVGSVVAFLASQDARWITGDIIRVDGGSKL
jgi:Enoyl-(Acyl carrier protein) reductase